MSTASADANDLRRRFGALSTGALTDVLYALGHGAQTMPAAVQALTAGARVAGPAFTYERKPFVPVQPANEADAWDSFRALPPEHVAVYVTHCADRAIIGDLAIAFLKVRACAGIVVDGGVRDVDALNEIGLPVFCRYTSPQVVSHGNGEEFTYGHEVSIGEVRIAPGDYVVGDADGVVVIPQRLIGEVLTRAEAVAAAEFQIRAAILAGEKPDDAYRRFT